MHPEVPIKVNAWVDQRLAPVVEALNAFPTVETFSSCQGDGHIYFRVRGEPEDLFRFIVDLARDLTEEISDSCCGFRLQLEWVGSHPSHGAMYVADQALNVVAQGLRRVSRRTRPCSGGTSHTDAAH